MAIADDPQQVISAYLGRLQKRLSGMSQESTGEIVEELRSHILDKATAGGNLTPAAVASALSALGSPEELASLYLTDELLAQAQTSRTPWTILRGVFHWATLSVRGFLVLIVSIVGYVFGASFFLAALIKPFNPKVGLWLIDHDTYQLALGMTDYRPQGHELLGWYLIPIGCALGGGTIMATTHFVLWTMRAFRQSWADSWPSRKA
jgi:hypothetical protein